MHLGKMKFHVSMPNNTVVVTMNDTGLSLFQNYATRAGKYSLEELNQMDIQLLRPSRS